MKSGKHLVLGAALLVCLSVPQLASAATPEQIAEAKTYYALGSKAYERGDFSAAIQAFDEAQRRAAHPTVVFSLAQAHRRQFYIDKSHAMVKAALDHFRSYLAQLPGGPRAADAAQAISELAPLEERLRDDPNAGKGEALQARTRLAISTSAVGAAEVSLDGKPFEETPLLAEVTAGKHSVTVRAPGYLDEVREIVAIEGSLVAVDVALRDKPASLQVSANDKARVEIDGRMMSFTREGRIPVQPGSHLVAVSLPGHDAFVREMTFVRGENKRLQVDLRASSRRRISNGLLIAGGVSLIGAGVLGALALERQGAAQDVLDARAVRNISDEERSAYESRRAARDGFAIAAGVGAGAALGFGAVGLALHVFDDPPRTAPSVGSDAPTSAPATPATKGPTDIGLAPWFSPQSVGAGLSGRF